MYTHSVSLAELGDRVGSHQAIDVRLNPLVELDQGLQLAGQGRRKTTVGEAFSDHRVFFNVHLVDVQNELGTESMVNVQFTRRGRGEICCKVSLAMLSLQTHCYRPRRP